jgi:hypothetical protein
MGFVGPVTFMHGNMTNAYTILVRKSEGKSPFGRHRHRWVKTLSFILQKSPGSMGWQQYFNLRITIFGLLTARTGGKLL